MGAVSIRNVRKTFGKVEILKGIDIEVEGGEFLILVGPSGCGKSTLLNMIAGLDVPTTGTIHIGDRDVTYLPSKDRDIAMVFQSYALYPNMNVAQNIAFGLEMRKVPKAQRDEAVQRVATMLQISHLLDRRPEKLSGGERQRVAIARALLTRPSLLLMDEPLAALDHARKEEILPYLEQLHETLKIPLLYVSHAPDEVARLADHIVVLDAGKAIAVGPLQDTLARLDLPIRLGEDAGIVLEVVVAEHDAEWQLAGVDFPGGRLWVRDKGIPLGRHVRVRILARDVSLAREKIEGTSIINSLPATVTALGDDAHPALCLVRLDSGGQPILARLTRRSAATLGLAPGQAVWAQIKAVALIG